jgi:hypothetical protein
LQSFPISHAFVLDGADGPAVQHVLGAIDAVHAGPALAAVTLTTGFLLPGEAGRYTFRLPKDRPDEIRVNLDVADWQLALVHEVGHLIDRVALGSGGEQFASLQHDPDLAEWWVAVRQSAAVRSLLAPKLGRETVPAALQDYLTYLLSEQELFARTYAQWIAARSGDATLLVQVALRREHREYDLPLPLQWEIADFVAIGFALDELFRRKGWLR